MRSKTAEGSETAERSKKAEGSKTAERSKIAERSKTAEKSKTAERSKTAEKSKKAERSETAERSEIAERSETAKGSKNAIRSENAVSVKNAVRTANIIKTKNIIRAMNTMNDINATNTMYATNKMHTTNTINAEPLITIIVPVYNIMEYLPRCVHSLTAQTYKNLEILLVDDGSTDGTAELCDRLAQEDGRIRVFHKENGGTSSARNLGLEKANGEYFGFADSDDYIEPQMYELLMNAIQNGQVKAAQAGRDEIAEGGEKLPDICIPPQEPQKIAAVDFLRELLLHRGDCSFCTKLIHRELFKGKSFPQGVLNEDFHLLIEMLPEIGQIVSLPQQTYHVFCRMGSNTRKADPNAFSRVFGDNVDNADMVLEIVHRDYPELAKIAVRFGIVQRLDYLLHIPIGQMNRENRQYRAIVKWLRCHWMQGMVNPYLTGKNKCYHTLFVTAPKGIRILHKKLRRKADEER